MKVKSGVKVTPSPEIHTTMQDCTVNGVYWDAKAVQSIQTIAEAFLENAKGLYELSKVLNSQHVHIDTVIQIGNKP